MKFISKRIQKMVGIPCCLIFSYCTAVDDMLNIASNGEPMINGMYRNTVTDINITLLCKI